MSYDRLDDLFRKKLKDRDFAPSDAAIASMEEMLGNAPKGLSKGFWGMTALCGVLLVGLGLEYFSNTQSSDAVYTERMDAEAMNDMASIHNELQSISASLPEDNYTWAASEKLNSKNQYNTKNISQQGNAALAESGEDQTTNMIRAVEATSVEFPLQGRENLSTSHSPKAKTTDGLVEETDPTQENIDAPVSSNQSSTTIDSSKPDPVDEQNSWSSISSNSNNIKDAVTTATTRISDDINAQGQNHEASPDKGGIQRDEQGVTSSLPEVNPIEGGVGTMASDGSDAFDEKSTLDPLASLGANLPDAEPEFNVETAVDSLAPFEFYVKDNKRLSFAIQPFFSVDRVSKSLSSGNEELQSIIDYRSQNESPIWSTSYGLDLLLRRGNLGFNSGFSMIELGEDVQYQNLLTDSITYEEIAYYEYLDTTFTEFVLDTLGMVIDTIEVTEINDSLLITSLDSTIVTTSDGRALANGITSITYFEVPLSLSYGFEVKRWKIEPSLGLAFGFLRGYSGKYLGADATLTDIGSQELVLKKTTVSMIYGLGIGYDFTNQISLWASYRNRRNLDSILEENGIKQRYNTHAMRIGLRYTF